MIETCKKCKYWELGEYKGERAFMAEGPIPFGICRRYPPQNDPSHDTEDAMRWWQPITHCTDWCGEWKVKTS